MASRLSLFLAELKRRKVYRVTVVYVIVGVGILGAAEVILDPLGLEALRPYLVILVVLGFPIALVLAWAYEVRPEEPPRAPKAAVPTEVTTTEQRKSIVVLPFDNLSPDPGDAYFSDGLTEEIITNLSYLRSLRVLSRNTAMALSGTQKDTRTIAEELDVQYVLEGSVRKAGDDLRITAQLIDAAADEHLWAGTFEQELRGVFSIQDEIARGIVDALKVQLDTPAGPQLVIRTTDSTEAYTLYLRGRYVFNRFRREDLGQSLSFYREALKVDPGFARAYAGMADSWMALADDWVPPQEAYPKAKEAAREALKLDSSLAEAHTAMGKALGWFDWDFDAAVKALRQAVALGPGYAEAHYGLGSVLPCVGSMEEGLAEMQEALALDPLSAEYAGWVARFLLYSGRYEEALAHSKETIRLDPQYYYAHVRAGNALLAMGKPEEALKAYREQAVRTGEVVSVRAYEAQALAALGRREEASDILTALEREERYVRSEFVAAAYGALREMDRAFQELDKALAARSAGLIYLHQDPIYEPLRDDSRYADLVERIGLKPG